MLFRINRPLKSELKSALSLGYQATFVDVIANELKTKRDNHQWHDVIHHGSTLLSRCFFVPHLWLISPSL
jgi:hypothetical protein